MKVHVGSKDPNRLLKWLPLPSHPWNPCAIPNLKEEDVVVLN